MTASISLAGAPLLLWLPIAPGFGLLILSLLAFEAIRRTAAGDATLHHPAWPWLARVGLTLLFSLSLIDLVRDTITLL